MFVGDGLFAEAEVSDGESFEDDAGEGVDCAFVAEAPGEGEAASCNVGGVGDFADFFCEVLGHRPVVADHVDGDPVFGGDEFDGLVEHFGGVVEEVVVGEVGECVVFVDVEEGDVEVAEFFP